MARRRDVVGEIVEKRQRLLEGVPRMEQFNKRVFPLVEGFRQLRKLDDETKYRDEWLKYGAVGYVACIEGYLRILFADLVDHGEPYLENVSNFKDLRLSIEPITAVQAGKITFGEFVSHLLPLSSVDHINATLSTLLGVDFLNHFSRSKIGGVKSSTIAESFPDTLERLKKLFRLRHQYAHELAPSEAVDPGEIERCISGGAVFVVHTEEIIRRDFLIDEPLLKP